MSFCTGAYVVFACFGRPIQFNQYILYMRKWFINFQEKINVKFLLASLKTLTNSIVVSKAASNFCSVFPSLSLVIYFTVLYSHCSAFGTIFRIIWRLSEQIFETQAAIRCSLKRETRRIFIIS